METKDIQTTLQQQYLQLCADYGNIEYQIRNLQETQEKLLNKMSNLNLQAEKEMKEKSKLAVVEEKQHVAANEETTVI